MGERFNQEMKDWLYDLSCGRLDPQACLQGLFKHYLAYGMTKDNVIQDIIYHTCYGMEGALKANRSLELLYLGVSGGVYKLV